MEWKDISDPNSEFDFYLASAGLDNTYTPEEIQAMINDRGVLAMVHTVNEHFNLTQNVKPIKVDWVGKRKAVVPF